MVGLIETCSGWNMMEGIKSWIKECYLSRREFLSCMNVIFFLGNEVNQPCFFEPFTKINVRIKDKLNMFSSFMSREILGTHFFFFHAVHLIRRMQRSGLAAFSMILINLRFLALDLPKHWTLLIVKQKKRCCLMIMSLLHLSCSWSNHQNYRWFDIELSTKPV